MPKSSSVHRSTAQRHRWSQERHLRRFQLLPANKSSGITWSEETFPKYIRAPMQDMPGTRMAFVGIKNDKDIADLWAYLKQFEADGAKK
jgi:cytochrome c2